jgi:serine/threonine-protein kinase
MKYCPACSEKFDDSLSFCPRDGEVLEEDSGSLVGKALDGQYQIEVMLGKGGMGAVYRARHILLGDRVAIKVLPPEMRSNTEWLRRFQREGQAARRFRHPNAVTVYDLRTSADGTIYLVMEYVEGNTLDVELKKHGRFSPAEAVGVLRPIMSVLNAAHAMGVVHRDLKPENIMIGKASTGGEPVVKLLDLGIAKLREVAGAEKTGNTNLTIAGQMLGTPYYMSPEQWGELPDDGNAEIDGRADIYSLGVVLYEIVAGTRPFKGFTLAELRREHIQVTPPPLHEINPAVSQAFSNVIARAIAKDRSQRQATAGDLEQELVSTLSAEGVSPSATLLDVNAAPGGTGEISRGVVTSPHQTAATMVTGIDEVAPPPQSDIPSQAATMPTVIAPAREHAPETIMTASQASSYPPAPQPAPPVAAAPKKTGSMLLLAGAGVLVLLLIVGVAGFFVIRPLISGPANNAASTTSTTNSPTGESEVAAGHEAGRYWLQVNSESDSVRAGEQVTLDSGQQFKIHFSPSESGYVYIVGPGDQNAPTTFLTANPASDFGVETNEVRSGEDFTFPADTKTHENWLNLDKNPGTDEFTVIFARKPLTTPSFLKANALHELTAAELQELDDLLGRNKANLLGTEVIKTGASPFVSVKIPQTTGEDAAVIFKIKIEHQ